jgi:hypothetical protein
MVTNTQDDFKIRSIDVVHINPSIMEGERGRSSILGPKTAVAIARWAPVFTTDPEVSGDFKIPSVLTCGTGVVSASPQPDYTFQWLDDGVAITGETGNTLTTSLAFDEHTLTCVVTATNSIGATSATSNGILAGIIEPIVAEGYSVFGITGLSQQYQQNLFKISSLVVTGMWVEDRFDSMGQSTNVITGIGIEDTLLVEHTEVAALWFPTALGPAGFQNLGAETGDMTGWTVVAGDIAAKTTALGTDDPAEGAYFFQSVFGSTIVSVAHMNQTVAIDAALEPDVDTENIWVRLACYVDSRYGNDDTVFSLQFLDASSTQISTVNLSGSDVSNWTSLWSELLPVPANTRFLKAVVYFYNDNSSDNYAAIDQMSVDLFSDAP